MGAVLDHENGWMQSKEISDIYCTREPQLAFHQRIQFCLDLHNHSVKAMRFPPKNYNQDLESAEDRREREAQDFLVAWSSNRKTTQPPASCANCMESLLCAPC